LASLFPEPNASAAGVRTQFLVQQLAEAPGVECVHYGTSANKPKQHDVVCHNFTITAINNSKQMLEELGVKFHYIPANDSNRMDDFLTDSGAKDPGKQTLVIIDRFFMEEAYSFHIHNTCPNAAIVLDMQDMHSLRWHRHALVKQRDSYHDVECTTQDQYDPMTNLPIGAESYPLAHDTKLQRELASIHRSDLTLVCSPAEMEALHSIYHIPKNKLSLASFFLEDIESLVSHTIPFEERKDFVFIGGFRHDPNVDAVWQMRRLWPQIKAKLRSNERSKTNFHVYGPFCPRPLLEACHNPSEGFVIHGLTKKSVKEILADKRVLLSPLRFGAGIKGKIVDAWTFGTPVVTSPVGSEGMLDSDDWGGSVATNSEEFVDAAVSLYQDESKWAQAHNRGHRLLSILYGMDHWKRTLADLVHLCDNLDERRRKDFTRSVLWQQTTKSTEYFSRWIEAKSVKP